MAKARVPLKRNEIEKIDAGDEDIHDGVEQSEENRPIPISKAEKDRLLASYKITLWINGRGCIPLPDDS